MTDTFIRPPSQAAHLQQLTRACQGRQTSGWNGYHPGHRSYDMPYIHKQLAAGRWFTLTYFEQLANVGSEVERTIRATKAGEEEQKERAFTRMLELLDLTLADARHQEQQQELLRLRELLLDVFQGENVTGTSFEWLSQHFLEYGIAARFHR